MLKVKKKIRNPKSQINDELTDLQNQIKNSIKNLFIKDQKNKKTINDYADLITKIRNEYYDENDESDSYISEIRKRPKKSQKRKII